MTNSESKVKPHFTERPFLWAILGIVLLSLVLCVIFPVINLIWWELKGPYRGITDVADLDGDGDLASKTGAGYRRCPLQLLRPGWETDTEAGEWSS